MHHGTANRHRIHNRGDRRTDLEEQSIATIGRCLAGKQKTSAMWELLINDAVVKTHWQMADFVATRKLGMNDHGETHAKVATASALTMLDLLEGSGVQPDIVAGGSWRRG